jgi:hypothetical protein
MSDLSIDTKKHTTKSRETIPLRQYRIKREENKDGNPRTMVVPFNYFLNQFLDHGTIMERKFVQIPVICFQFHYKIA